jgi:hypothetical protein
VYSHPDGTTTARVNGVLSVARAMGDFELAAYITCEPDVFRLQSAQLADNVFIMACDGLWDVVDDNLVSRFVVLLIYLCIFSFFLYFFLSLNLYFIIIYLVIFIDLFIY